MQYLAYLRLRHILILSQVADALVYHKKKPHHFRMSLFYLAIFSLLTFSEHFAKIIFTGYFSEYTMLKAEKDGKQLPTKPGGGMPPQGGIFGAV